MNLKKTLSAAVAAAGLVVASSAQATITVDVYGDYGNYFEDFKKDITRKAGTFKHNANDWGGHHNKLTLNLATGSGAADMVLVDTGMVGGYINGGGLMDLTDNQNVEISDLWGRFIDPIQLASTRYTPEAIVIIRVSKNGNSFSSADITPECDLLCMQSTVNIDWHIVMTNSNKVETGNQYQGVNEETLINTTISDITSYISQKYALTTETGNELVIDVANIDSLTKYVEVSQFLQKLSAISAVKLIKAEGNNRRFELTIIGSTESIIASLQLNNQLKQYIDPLIGQRINDVPVFYWGTE